MNPTMQPPQLLCVRGVISTIWSILYVNKDIKRVVYDDISRSLFWGLFQRSIQATILIFIQFTIVKYLSLVFIGLAQNITPLVTIVLSYFMTGERLKKSDFVMIFITFVGVTFVTIGF